MFVQASLEKALAMKKQRGMAQAVIEAAEDELLEVYDRHAKQQMAEEKKEEEEEEEAKETVVTADHEEE
jgi:hypothetical protein